MLHYCFHWCVVLVISLAQVIITKHSQLVPLPSQWNLFSFSLEGPAL